MAVQANAIDRLVGANLRRLRSEAGLTQTALAERIGVSCAQIGLYEAGIDHLSASRLWQCTRVLGAPVSAFFRDREWSS